MMVGYCDGCCDEDLGIVVSKHRYTEHHQSKHPGLWHIVKGWVCEDCAQMNFEPGEEHDPENSLHETTSNLGTRSRVQEWS